jgi:enamine deaminase RidA (YjgF/YER057c/UK114 family)
MKDFEAMNEVYREFFSEDPPARTTIGAQLPKIKVEIDCIARRRRRKVNPYRATRRRFIGME